MCLFVVEQSITELINHIWKKMFPSFIHLLSFSFFLSFFFWLEDVSHDLGKVLRIIGFWVIVT